MLGSSKQYTQTQIYHGASDQMSELCMGVLFGEMRWGRSRVLFGEMRSGRPGRPGALLAPTPLAEMHANSNATSLLPPVDQKRNCFVWL